MSTEKDTIYFKKGATENIQDIFFSFLRLHEEWQCNYEMCKAAGDISQYFAASM